MNPNIDMSVILEALQRRSQGGQDMASAQQTPTTGQIPTGGANTPVPQQPAPPNMPMPNKDIASMLKGSQATSGPNFDDETKTASKLLIQKLLKYV